MAQQLVRVVLAVKVLINITRSMPVRRNVSTVVQQQVLVVLVGKAQHEAMCLDDK